MTVPTISSLPPAPARAQPQDDFNAVADAFSSALPVFVSEVNDAVEWAADTLDQINEDAGAVAGHKTAAGLSAGAAATAAGQAQIAAGIAGAEAGLPSLSGKAGNILAVKEDESGLEYIPSPDTVPIGAVIAGWNLDPEKYVPCDGQVYDADDWPESAHLFDEIGYADPALFSHTAWAREAGPDAVGSWDRGCYAPELEMALLLRAEIDVVTVATTTDGINWVKSTATGLPFNSLNEVIWCGSLGLFALAVSGKTEIYTSPDGINWTSRTTGLSSATTAMCWAEDIGRLVLVRGTAASGAVYSDDLVNFSSPVSSGVGNITSIARRPGVGFVAVSSSGTCATSTDGTSWTSGTMASANSWQSVVWADSLSMFVAVSFDGTNRVNTSPNGTSWTNRTPPSSQWRHVKWLPDVSALVAVGSSAIMTSTNGTSWTARTHPGTAATWRFLIWAPIWGAVFGSGTGIAGVSSALLTNRSAFRATGFRVPDYATIEDEFAAQDTQLMVKLA